MDVIITTLETGMADSLLASAPRARSRDVQALIGYAKQTAEPIEFHMLEPDKSNLVIEPHEVLVRDVRTAEVACFDMSALDGLGFAYIKHEGTLDINDQVYLDNVGDTFGKAPSASTSQYLSDLAQHIKTISGARDVFPQLRGLLSRASTRKGNASFHKPAGFAHIDYTPEQAENQIPLALELAGAEAKPYSRYVLYQTWRAISKGPQDSALAICDGRSASPDNEQLLYTFLPKEIPLSVIHTRLPTYNAEHRWYYLSDMQPEDLLIFPAYDTARPGAMNAMHVAFDNPLADEEAEPRRSIEARFIALFD